MKNRIISVKSYIEADEEMRKKIMIELMKVKKIFGWMSFVSLGISLLTPLFTKTNSGIQCIAIVNVVLFAFMDSKIRSFEILDYVLVSERDNKVGE